MIKWIDGNFLRHSKFSKYYLQGLEDASSVILSIGDSEKDASKNSTPEKLDPKSWVLFTVTYQYHWFQRKKNQMNIQRHSNIILSISILNEKHHVDLNIKLNAIDSNSIKCTNTNFSHIKCFMYVFWSNAKKNS
jgi:hypothetical protein